MYIIYIIYIYIIYIIYIIPLAIGGVLGPLIPKRDPQGQVPKNYVLNKSLLSRVGSYILYNHTTKSGTFHSRKFRQGRFIHATKSE